MDNAMNADHEELQKLIDACRVNSDDLSLPEMERLAVAIESDEQIRAQFERAQGVDLTIGRAFQDVEVPAGLRERLLDKVEPARPRRRWRRHSVAVAGTAALLLIVLLVVGAVFSTSRAPDVRLADRDVQEYLVRNWQGIDFRFNGQGSWPEARVADLVTCYDLSYGPHADVRLFRVAESDASDLPSLPPREPDYIGGWYVGFWESDGQVLVLAVSGEKNVYKDLLSFFTHDLV